jgi:hypothetical protein
VSFKSLSSRPLALCDTDPSQLEEEGHLSDEVVAYLLDQEGLKLVHQATLVHTNHIPVLTTAIDCFMNGGVLGRSFPSLTLTRRLPLVSSNAEAVEYLIDIGSMEFVHSLLSNFEYERR